MMQTKSIFNNKLSLLNTIINITKKTGQGISGYIRQDEKVNKWLDELISEGYIISYKNKKGTSKYSEWLLPSNIYNVWFDKDHYDNNSLTYLKLYMGYEDIIDITDDNHSNVEFKKILKDPEFLSNYLKWLKENLNQLIKIDSLEIIKTIDYQNLNKEEINWLKKQEFYKKNLTVKECLRISQSIENQNKEILILCKKLLKRFEKNSEYYKDKINAAKNEISTIENSPRISINKWLLTKNKNINIKNIVL